ncbi:glycosyltransferase family 32 protein [Parabacteroides bouchesdurhonensis]|uniref:glycosyltransferase family 32 protein n=1 Tax=Parabacteroides bouchesdurhonensis TaxID=1936995 RepID=UPI000C85AE9C|nr:glycosyltransferase [Parabacteroides bouchesdurhonensis]
MAIPKKIHWCWLSGDPLPANIRQCINSWKRIMPDYEIICWDKERFDIQSVPFVEQAYACRKYAFAADYIRLYVLYTEGGIYLDSDVMVFERFDKYLKWSAFSSVEFLWKVWHRRNDEDRFQKYQGYGIQSAIMGAEAGNLWIKECLDYYSDKSIRLENGKIKGINIITEIMASIAEKWGFKYDVFEDQYLKDNIVIYTPFTFATLWEMVSFRTSAIHLGEQSWLVDGVLARRKDERLRRRLARLLCSKYRIFAVLYYWIFTEERKFIREIKNA